MKMCRVFEVDPSCYYKWLKGLPSSSALRRISIASEIFKIHQQNRGRYGSPRISSELAAGGLKVSRSLVGRIMAELNLRKVKNQKFKKTTIASSKHPVTENILNQNFNVSKKCQVWVSDITYIKTKEGWSYLTIIIDLFDRKVIGWSLSTTMKPIDTSIAAFQKALLNRSLSDKDQLIFHSDRGSQYTCKDFVALLKERKQIVQSMSGKGRCYDNAVAESFFKTLKNELVSEMAYLTTKDAEESISDYIENYYNIKRRHSALGNFTIEEFHKLLSSQNKNILPD